MSKQQLAKVRIDFFVVLKYRQAHVPQAQALHPGAVIPLLPQRHQGPLQRRHRVSGFRRHAVAFTGGAGGGIADAAGGQNDGLCGISSLFSVDAVDRSAPDVQRHGPVPAQNDFQGFQPPLQGAADVESPVGHREYPVSTLRFQWHAQALKKRLGVPAIKAGKSTVQEFAVFRCVCQQFLQPRVVGDVAPTLSGDI